MAKNQNQKEKKKPLLHHHHCQQTFPQCTQMGSPQRQRDSKKLQSILRETIKMVM